jgi:hypothetical protein
MKPDNTHLNPSLSQADKVLLEEEMVRANASQDNLIKRIIHWWAVLVDSESKRVDVTLVLPPEFSALNEDETLHAFLDRVEVFVIETVRARETTMTGTAARLQYDRKQLSRILKANGSSRRLPPDMVPKHRQQTHSGSSPVKSRYRKIQEDSVATDGVILRREARRRGTNIFALTGKLVHQWADQRRNSNQNRRRIILPAKACVFYQDEGLKTFLNRLEIAAVQSTCFVEPNQSALHSRLACAQIRRIFIQLDTKKRRGWRAHVSKQHTREGSPLTPSRLTLHCDELRSLLKANRAALALQECNYNLTAASALLGAPEDYFKTQLTTPIPANVTEAFIATRPDHNPANNELARQATKLLTSLSNSATLSLADLERAHILSVVEQTNNDVMRAAQLLGISPLTLYRQLATYDALSSDQELVSGLTP